MADIEITLDEKMPDQEKEDLAELIRGVVHNEWYGQYSNTVIGPVMSQEVFEEHDRRTDDPDHLFEGYDANPNICRHCGAVAPMPCYKIKRGETK